MRYLLAHQMKFWSIETSMNLALDRGDNLGVPETSQRRLWDSVTDFDLILLDQLWLCVVDMFRIFSVSYNMGGYPIQVMRLVYHQILDHL